MSCAGEHASTLRARRRRAAGSACSGRPSSGRSALGSKNSVRRQVAGVVEGRRLTRPLLLEDLDQRLFLPRGRVLLERVADEDRVVEEREDGLVRARVEHKAGLGILVRQGAQKRRDRKLALAIDARVRDALLVDLELEPQPRLGIRLALQSELPASPGGSAVC